MRIQYLAGFLIYLILSIMIVIPLQVSAFSATVTGDANIPNIREKTDITKISAIAESQVSLKSLEGQTYQMTCDEGEQFTCEYTFSENTLDSGVHEITLTQEEGEPQSITKKFYVDGDAPEITINKKEIVKTTEGTKLNLSLKIIDPTYETDTDCSGIRTISITTESQTLFSKSLNHYNCEYELKKLISLPSTEGNLSLIMTVSDFLGQTTIQNLGNISVDTQAPRIKDNIKFFWGEKEITSIAKKPRVIPVVRLTISIEDKNLSKVYIDASKITKNPHVFPTYKNLEMNCVKQEQIFVCKKTDLELNPSTNKINFTIKAIDSEGNQIIKNITKEIEIVDKSGKITYFNPEQEHCKEEKCYVKKGLNNFIIKINHNETIIPSLITINTGTYNFHPTTCNQTSSSSYLCTANLLITKNQSGLENKIQLVNPSTDLNGNNLEGITKTKVIIDADKPEIITLPQFSEMCPTAGMSSIVNVTVKDITSPTLLINIKANKTTTEGIFTKECKKTSEGEFNCQIKLTNFVNYPESENISIEITDLAGNKLELEEPFEVCQAETQVAPETVRKITTETNQKINKRLATAIATKIFLPLTFEIQSNIASKTKIIALETDGCINTKYLGGEPYFLNEDEFIENQNLGVHRGEAILVVPIGKQMIAEDEAEINCTINIYETIKNTRYTKPEKQTLQISIPTYNNPLGTVDQATTKQLKTIKDEIKGLQTDIDKRMKLHQTFKTICMLSDILGKVSEALAIVQSAVYVVAVVMQVWPVTAEPGQELWKGVCNTITKGFFKNKKKLFKDNFLENSGSILKQFLKAGCTIYNCGFCTVDGLMTVASLTIQTGKDMKDLDIGNKQGTDVDKSSDVNSASELNQQSNKPANSDDGGDSSNSQSAVSTSKQTTSSSKNTLNDLDKMSEEVGKEMLQKASTLKYKKPVHTFAKKFKNEGTSDWIIDPYKSKTYAGICLCNSGMIYALNKERQLKCREYKCIQNAAQEGLPIYNCQKDYAIGSCLYVEGAISKKTLLRQLWDGIKNSLLKDPIKATRMVLCVQDYLPIDVGWSTQQECDSVFTGALPTFCSLTDAYLHLRTVKNLYNNVFKSKGELLAPDGEDYCQGISMD